MVNLFDGKKFGIKPKAPTYRVEKVAEKPKPKPLPSKIAASKPAHPPLLQRKKSEVPVRSVSSTARSSPAPLEENVSRGGGLKPAKRKATRQITPQRIESDSEDDDESSTDFEDIGSKRQRSERPVDVKRQLRSKQGFSEEDGGRFEMIHAADVSALERKPKGSTEEIVAVELQYPSASQRERYNLVFGKDAIDPAHEILNIATQVTNTYLTQEQAKIFKDPNTGIIRQLTRAKNLLTSNAASQVDRDLLLGFKSAVKVYNSAIGKLIKDGALARNLDNIHELPFDTVTCILDQVYSRAVSPKVDILKKRHADAENEKDNTYGELNGNFISSALAKVRLESDQVFVDLGSGVGNVVLRAALEFGCESFGCEMVENACMLAEAQKQEFAARCRLWGINSGKVQLEQANFFDSPATHEAIKRADVILVNNEVFSSDTNARLLSLFLDCKDGCKIISLQPFVEPGHEITERNLYDPRNLLEVERHRYSENYVSWKAADGDYFISTKDSKRLEAFSKKS